ncbi:glycosyltransferase family 1 protein [Oceanimonas doudoroffii]|uniref:glycosyltransferase family 1 protein n=1 Tax=Oceanimonas doudoroffii TaxID=84158 RepID=UPI001FE2FA2B|nr:glycosyltransferase family 1 protein [Oceanimonas doudoroffii]
MRYLTPAWRQWVENNRAQLGQLAFFMDDDLFDPRAHAGLPLRYRYKLWLLARRHKRWLQRMGAELWVSTPFLAKKYAEWSPLVLQPQSPYAHSTPQKTLFYHGSASHGAEFAWLYPVFEQVLAQDANLSVELIGNHRVRRQYAALPRVHVLHPMSWPAYQALLARPGRTIGLVPLLNNRFNAARAPTKFFDITQAGAVGIYADHPIYRSVIRHPYNGLLLPMDQQAWVNAILRLSENKEERKKMCNNAARLLQRPYS